MKLAIDLYNASDDRPVSNLLQFSGLTPGWMVRPQPIDIPMLLTFQVRCQELDAEFNLSEARFGRQATAPLELTFTEGHKLSKTPLRFVLPVAASDRREGGLRIDGSIEDWAPEDAVQDGPMVEMFSGRCCRSSRSNWPIHRASCLPDGVRTIFTWRFV